VAAMPIITAKITPVRKSMLLQNFREISTPFLQDRLVLKYINFWNLDTAMGNKYFLIKFYVNF